MRFQPPANGHGLIGLSRRDNGSSLFRNDGWFLLSPCPVTPCANQSIEQPTACPPRRHHQRLARPRGKVNYRYSFRVGLVSRSLFPEPPPRPLVAVFLTQPVESLASFSSPTKPIISSSRLPVSTGQGIVKLDRRPTSDVSPT